MGDFSIGRRGQLTMSTAEVSAWDEKIDMVIDRGQLSKVFR